MVWHPCYKVVRHQERERESSTDGECHTQRLSYCGLFYDMVYSKRHGEHIKGFPNTNHAWCKLLKDRTDGRYDFTVDLHGHLLPHDNPAQRERETRSNLRIPNCQRAMVQRFTQKRCIAGFPNVGCPWCKGELKNRAQSTATLRGIARGVKPISKGQSSTTPCVAPERGA